VIVVSVLLVPPAATRAGTSQRDALPPTFNHTKEQLSVKLRIARLAELLIIGLYDSVRVGTTLSRTSSARIRALEVMMIFPN
jgi:hypothetical protein